MNRISREFWFSAAHRIEGHPKCGRLHGHNYKVVVYISGGLDMQGMVIDFGEVDRIVKPLIDEMDHRYLVSRDNLEHEDEYAHYATDVGDAVFVPVDHSTAEELARYIHARVWGALNMAPGCISITVQETPRNEAHFTFEV